MVPRQWCHVGTVRSAGRPTTSREADLFVVRRTGGTTSIGTGTTTLTFARFRSRGFWYHYVLLALVYHEILFMSFRINCATVEESKTKRRRNVDVKSESASHRMLTRPFIMIGNSGYYSEATNRPATFHETIFFCSFSIQTHTHGSKHANRSKRFQALPLAQLLKNLR